jgi:peptidoglycan/LPS O-acetylase OafA/YrhL
VPPTQPQDKIAGIELLLFLPAFAVLLAHYNHFFIYHPEHEGYTFYNQPLFGYLEFFYRYGTRAVEVFWCLSGFVFVHKYGRPIFAQALLPLKFFWLRFSRLYPLHFAALVLITVLQYVYRAKTGTFWVIGPKNLKHFVLQLGFASHWGFEAADSFNTAVGSVSLEVLAYAVCYVVTFFIGAG